MASCLDFFFFLVRGASKSLSMVLIFNYMSSFSIMSLRLSLSLQEKFLDNNRQQQQQHNHGLAHGFQWQHRTQTSRWYQTAARTMHINMVLCRAIKTIEVFQGRPNQKMNLPSSQTSCHRSESVQLCTWAACLGAEAA